MTWNKGDYVVHRRDGICRITDISEMALTKDGPRMYYILTPIYETGSKIYTPCDMAGQQLRDPVTREEADHLIDQIPELPDNWISDQKARQRFLTEAVKHGTNETLLTVINTLYQKRKEQAASGRKFHSSDERFLDEAEQSVNREFAFVLGIEPDDVPEYIRNRLDHIEGNCQVEAEIDV